MHVKNDAPKQDVTKTVNHSDVSTVEQKKREAEMESYFNPKDSADISSEGREMQKALSNTKVLSMPKDSDGSESAGYSKQSVSSVQQASRAESKSKSNDMVRLNQIASKMMQGQTVSSAEMKELEIRNPQLYARAKAKAKANTNTQTNIPTESQVDEKESK